MRWHEKICSLCTSRCFSRIFHKDRNIPAGDHWKIWIRGFPGISRALERELHSTGHRKLHFRRLWLLGRAVTFAARPRDESAGRRPSNPAALERLLCPQREHLGRYFAGLHAHIAAEASQSRPALPAQRQQQSALTEKYLRQPHPGEEKRALIVACTPAQTRGNENLMSPPKPEEPPDDSLGSTLRLAKLVESREEQHLAQTGSCLCTSLDARSSAPIWQP
ncbi:Hypothetical predicted protein [Cloeon dipterum]|uniref:Uncharacterized protein n=1 Tax=Cloeon dipterum TaxID=197152 RepID=A0A8S1DEY1_9INSE|nr:Hypothetical predicted protein [Cloeon dipterum]